MSTVATSPIAMPSISVSSIVPRLVLPLALAVGACSAPSAIVSRPAMPDAAGVSLQAAALAQSALIVDTHIDVPYRLAEAPDDVSVRTAGGDFDHPRALSGGLDVAFMSIYTSADLQDTPGASAALADSLIGMVEQLAADHPAKFAVVTSTADVARLRRPGRVLLALGMENGAPIEDLDALKRYAERGVRYVTLTHSKANRISDSSYDEERPWGGLSPYGETVVREMNHLGVMVDVSHVSDEAFYDVLDLTDVPVIASHSSARHFTPGFERNMDDAMIRRLAEEGGVIQINFGSSFLSERYRTESTALRARFGDAMASRGLVFGTPEADAFQKTFEAENPLRLATLSDVADHIDHVVSLVGVEHVGIGSDYDGVGPTLPVGLEDVSTFPNLVAELLRRGYSEADVRLILGENVMRVWRAVERAADGG